MKTCLLWLAAAAAAALMSGCAGAPRAKTRLLAHGSLSLPTDAQRIGLSHFDPATDFSVRLPSTRGDASADFALEFISNPGDGVAAVPAAYVVGRLIGAALGVDKARLEPGQRAVRAVANEFSGAPRLEEIVTRVLHDDRGPRVSVLEPGLPVEPPRRHGRFTAGGESRLTWAAGTPVLHPLHDTFIDTLVSLRVVSQGLCGPSLFRPDGSRANSPNEFNPPLTCEVVVEVTAVRVRDWALLGSVQVRGESGPRRFLEWAADDARELRTALAAAWVGIEREISSRLARSARTPTVSQS